MAPEVLGRSTAAQRQGLSEPLPALDRWYAQWGKRALDFSLSLVGLLLVSPLIVVLACLVRLLLGSPVLFRQERPGRFGRPFNLLKFRTMTDDRDAQGQLQADVLRLSGFGRFLRSASLDELPELWNVVLGDMSLVGPRPLLMRYLDRYTSEQARRHKVRPGITGLAQIKGRNALTWERKFEWDVYYVDHVNLRLDVRVLWLTLIAVLRRQGVSAEGHATMPEFMGTAASRDGE